MQVQELPGVSSGFADWLANRGLYNAAPVKGRRILSSGPIAYYVFNAFDVFGNECPNSESGRITYDTDIGGDVRSITYQGDGMRLVYDATTGKREDPYHDIPFP